MISFNFRAKRMLAFDSWCQRTLDKTPSIKVLDVKPISWIFGAIAWLQNRKWLITRKRKELKLCNHAASDIIRLFRSFWSGYWALYLFSNQSYIYFKSRQRRANETREKVALPLKLNFRLFFGDYWDYNLQLKAENPLFTECSKIMQDMTGLLGGHTVKIWPKNGQNKEKYWF